MLEDKPTLTCLTPQETTDHIVKILQDQSKNLRIMHVNTQSMVSTFNEFLLMTETCPMGIITMSETWLKNNSALLEYVTIPGYTTVFRSPSIKDGGVGAYIRDSIPFKHRKDIELLKPELEHLWIEIPGRNKHSKALLGKRILTYSDWLEHIEALLGHLTVEWDGLPILTGDMNIDMLQPRNPV